MSYTTDLPADPPALAPDPSGQAPIPGAVLLSTLSRRGQQVTVRRVLGDDLLSRRLGDLGLVPGAVVRLVHVSLFSWPRAYLLHDYRLALRRDEAARIEVTP